MWDMVCMAVDITGLCQVFLDRPSWWASVPDAKTGSRPCLLAVTSLPDGLLQQQCLACGRASTLPCTRGNRI
jgi:hypothetical protein